jgi:hypothetical protein
VRKHENTKAREHESTRALEHEFTVDKIVRLLSVNQRPHDLQFIRGFRRHFVLARKEKKRNRKLALSKRGVELCDPRPFWSERKMVCSVDVVDLCRDSDDDETV